MKRYPVFELLFLIALISLSATYLRDKPGGEAFAPGKGGDPDLLLYLPLDGDARNHGALDLETKVMQVKFESDSETGGGYGLFSQESYISVLDPSQFNGMSEFTLSAWVHPELLREHLNVISKVAPSRDFNLQIDRYGQVVTHINVSGYEFCYTKDRIEAGRWTHLAATFKDRTWTIFIDGRVAAEQTMKSVPAWGGNNLTVGNLFPDAGEAFLGGLDEIRIYKRALNPSEVERLASSRAAVREST